MVGLTHSLPGLRGAAADPQVHAGEAPLPPGRPGVLHSRAVLAGRGVVVDLERGDPKPLMLGVGGSICTGGHGPVGEPGATDERSGLRPTSEGVTATLSATAISGPAAPLCLPPPAERPNLSSRLNSAHYYHGAPKPNADGPQSWADSTLVRRRARRRRPLQRESESRRARSSRPIISPLRRRGRCAQAPNRWTRHTPLSSKRSAPRVCFCPSSQASALAGTVGRTRIRETAGAECRKGDLEFSR